MYSAVAKALVRACDSRKQVSAETLVVQVLPRLITARNLLKTLADVQYVTSQLHPAPLPSATTDEVKGYDVTFCTSDTILRRYLGHSSASKACFSRVTWFEKFSAPCALTAKAEDARNCDAAQENACRTPGRHARNTQMPCPVACPPRPDIQSRA